MRKKQEKKYEIKHEIKHEKKQEKKHEQKAREKAREKTREKTEKKELIWANEVLKAEMASTKNIQKSHFAGAFFGAMFCALYKYN